MTNINSILSIFRDSFNDFTVSSNIVKSLIASTVLSHLDCSNQKQGLSIFFSITSNTKCIKKGGKNLLYFLHSRLVMFGANSWCPTSHRQTESIHFIQSKIDDCFVLFPGKEDKKHSDEHQPKLLFTISLAVSPKTSQRNSSATHPVFMSLQLIRLWPVSWCEKREKISLFNWTHNSFPCLHCSLLWQWICIQRLPRLRGWQRALQVL